MKQILCLTLLLMLFCYTQAQRTSDLKPDPKNQIFHPVGSPLTITKPDIKNLKLDNKQFILHDRAYFTFPSGAVNSPRKVDIMAADHNDYEETRIVLDIDKKKLVFFAHEMYQLADDALLREVSSNVDSTKARYKELINKNGLVSVLRTPMKFDSTRQAILVNTLIVKTADSDVFQIDAFINPQAYASRDEYIALTRQVFETLKPGTRYNEKQARQEEMNIFQTPKGFIYELPAGYSITQDQKYDFQVFNFHHYTFITDTNWVNLTIYVGRHPSSFYTEYGFDPQSAKSAQGKFLGKDVDWQYFVDDQRHLYLQERKIDNSGIGNDLIVHIAMMSNRPAALAELNKIVENIRLR